MSRRLLLIVILSGGFIPPAQAKTVYRPGDWVSYSNFRYVNAIAADQRYAYFATTGGISRYNLFTNTWAEPFTTSDGLPDNRVRVVAVDPLFNELWCATRAGVSRYNSTTETWTTYTSGGGLFLDDVHSIGVSEDGLILFATQNGTAQFDRRSEMWQIGGLTSRFGGGSSPVRWYGAQGQAGYRYPTFITDFEYIFTPPEFIQDRFFRTYRLTSFFEDTFANLWIGTWGLNVGKASLRSLRLTFLRTGLVSQNVTALSRDGDDLWFGSTADVQDDGGITRLNRRTGEWTYFEPRSTDGLRSGTISAIVSDTAAIWFGTADGLVWYDKDANDWTTLPTRPLTSRNVTALALSDTTLWVGTAAGINRMNRRTRTILPVPQPALRDLRVYDLAVDADQAVWVGTDRGVYRRTADGVWKKIEDPNSGQLNGAVFGVAMDSLFIWFGTPSTLARFNRADGTWNQWLLPVGTGSGRLRLSVSDRAVWLGSRGGAVKFDKRRETWTVYTTKDGLLDETVQAILLDGDYIWFGTQAGVTRFHWNDPSRLE
ncbi:MAG: hypothetical protein HY710_11925 [Candidatus Latescibacteria bacterium]|nr:hypothetical protein [Candidatus Latescibacterota bacterium]